MQVPGFSMVSIEAAIFSMCLDRKSLSVRRNITQFSSLLGKGAHFSRGTHSPC